MSAPEIEHLRVLIANEKRERLETVAGVVAGLGHEVIAREIYVKEVGASTSRERPDVALVGLGLNSEHALDLISEIVREAACPVIALLHANGDSESLASALAITLRRFAEYQNLQGAFGHRAMIEQAKGILMARHMINADAAFGMLRNHSQTNGRKLIDIAEVLSPATRCCSPERRNRCPSRKPRVVSTEVPPYRGNVEARAERWPFEPNTVAGMTMFRRSRRGETSLTTRAVTSSAFGFCLQ